MVATIVTTSVRPAEYSVRSPYVASAITTNSSGRSSLRNFRSTRAVDRQGVGGGRAQDGVVGGRRRTVVRQDELVAGGGRIGAEIVRDDPHHHRSSSGTVPAEFQHRANDDLWVVRRGKADEPAVVRPLRVLRCSRLAGNLEIGQ